MHGGSFGWGLHYSNWLGSTPISTFTSLTCRPSVLSRYTSVTCQTGMFFLSRNDNVNPQKRPQCKTKTKKRCGVLSMTRHCALHFCFLSNEITHKDKKDNTHVTLTAKHGLQEWLRCLPKDNKALSNPFIPTCLCFCSLEMTVVWDCTSSQMSSWCVLPSVCVVSYKK